MGWRIGRRVLASRFHTGSTASGSRPRVAENLGEATAFDELHRVIMHSSIAADREDRHDVRMVQGRGDLGLDLEPGKLLAVQTGGRSQNFQGDPSAQRSLLGLVDDPHPTPADLTEHAEFAQGLRHRQCGEWRFTSRRQFVDHPHRGQDLGKHAGDLGITSGIVADVWASPRVSCSRNSSATLATRDAIEVGVGVDAEVMAVRC